MVIAADGKWPGHSVGISMTRTAGSTLSTTIYADLSTRCRSWTVTRGPFAPSGVAQPGRATIVLDNRDGAFDLLGSGAYSTRMGPGLPVEITANYGGTTYVLFIGYVDEWVPEWDTFDSKVTVTALDRFGIAARVGIQNTTAVVGYEDTPSERIDRALQAVNWTTKETDMERGMTVLQGTTFNQSLLDAITEAVEGEGPDGRCFVTSSGWIEFRQRDWTIRESATPGTTLADSRIAAAQDTHFKNPVVSIGRENMVNHALYRQARAVSNSTRAVAEHASTASTAKWGRIAEAHTIATMSVRDLEPFAAWRVARGTDGYQTVPTQRVKSVSPVPQNASTSTPWKNTLNAELLDRVRLKWKPPHDAGTTYTEEARLVGLTHTVTASPRTWEVSWQLESASFDSTGSGSLIKARDVFKCNNSDLPDGSLYWGP